MEELRKCKKCKSDKPVTSFGKLQGGKYRRRTCSACCKKRERIGKENSRNESSRVYRRENPIRSILYDSRGSDRKKELLGNDLDFNFVEDITSRGCSYCGDLTGRISLDRIDNAKPHTKNNVVPACFRCNYIRNSMPYEAWLHIVPLVKSAKELGLFGDWRTTPFN